MTFSRQRPGCVDKLQEHGEFHIGSIASQFIALFLMKASDFLPPVPPPRRPDVVGLPVGPVEKEVIIMCREHGEDFKRVAKDGERR